MSALDPNFTCLFPPGDTPPPGCDGPTGPHPTEPAAADPSPIVEQPAPTHGDDTSLPVTGPGGGFTALALTLTLVVLGAGSIAWTRRRARAWR